MRDSNDSLVSFLGRMEGYTVSKVLTTAAKFGLLPPSRAEISPEAFARSKALSPKGIRLLLNALAGLGIYEKRGNAFRLKGDIRRLFEDHHGLVDDLIHHDHLYDVWGRLEEGIRTGKSVPPPEEDTRHYPATLEVFLRAMRAHAGYLAPEILAVIPWAGVRRLLDIGGGGGGHATGLTRRFPYLTVTIVDLPDAVALTKEMTAAESRILYHPCNAYTDPLPEGPFDRILISHLLHIYPAGDNSTLLAKAAERLRPGGDLLLLDYFLDETETRPREAVFFRLLMMIGTPEGDCYRLSEAKTWLVDAGLIPGAVHTLPRGNTLIAAGKP